MCCFHFTPTHNVSFTSLLQTVNLYIGHPSQKVDILTSMYPILHCLKLSTCWSVTNLEDQHVAQNVSYTSLPHNDDLSPILEGWHIGQNVSYTASKCLHVNLSLSPEGQHIGQNVSYTSLPQNVGRSNFQLSQNVDICFLHFSGSKCQYVDLSLSPVGWHIDQYVSYTIDLYLHWTRAYEYINCIDFIHNI